jgi:predicted pyridoxine 5'-phosphate oxidase superfamily flavin-nucleotide-binding protein
VGNLSENQRVMLFLIDFESRTRIKVWGRARVVEDDPELLARLADPAYRAKPERAIVIDVTGWDLNCRQHITPRIRQDDTSAASENWKRASRSSKQGLRREAVFAVLTRPPLSGPEKQVS